MKKLLMGIDIGTSACKVAIFTPEGYVVSSESCEYNIYYPKQYYVEQDPREWWDGVCTAIGECFKKSNITASDIAAVGIDGQSWSAIAMDKNGNVSGNTPIWMDRRAKDICDETIARVGFETIFSVSGNPFEPTYSLPKIMWYKKHRPDIYNNTKYFGE